MLFAFHPRAFANTLTDLNPATRVGRFTHLRGKVLAEAIASLPVWEQLHELKFLFNDFDVLVRYLIDIEHFTVPSRRVAEKANWENQPLVVTVVAHGFWTPHQTTVQSSYMFTSAAIGDTMNTLCEDPP